MLIKKLLCIAILGFATAAHAAYPDKPIRLVVGFPVGQATDVIARLAAKKLQEVLKQPVFVDNKAGAGGIIGAQDVAKAAPDGYTFLVSSSGPLAVNPSLYSKLPYDSKKDFAPVAELTVLPLFLAVHPASPAKSVQELVQLAKAEPGRLNYASAGNGVTSHLTMELFMHSAGISMTHIPYKGSPAAGTSLMGGQVDTMIDTGPALVPHGKSGLLRILVVTTPKRVSTMPGVPTMIESGFEGFDAVAWVGLVAPKGTPREIINTVHEALSQAWLEPEVKDALAALGGEAVLTSPDDFSRRLDSEIKRWGQAVKLSGARVD